MRLRVIKANLLIKLDIADKTNRKDINSVDFEFDLKYKLKRLTDSKKVTSMQVFQFFKNSVGSCELRKF